MSRSNTKDAMPGQRWLANLQPVDAAPSTADEMAVKLVDYDPRTDTWTVEKDDNQFSAAILAKHLIRCLEQGKN